jgi:hypothetical protein
MTVMTVCVPLFQNADDTLAHRGGDVKPKSQAAGHRGPAGAPRGRHCENGPAPIDARQEEAMATNARMRAMAAALVGLAALGTAALAIGNASGLIRPAGETAPGPPRFVEEAVAAGIEHTYDGEYTFFVGGGVAAFDCDDDGRSELYIAGGSQPAGLYLNRSAVGGPLRFARRPDPATDLSAVTGAYPLDVDGDRRVDLAVLRLGGNVLLRGLGGCRFEEANARFGLDGGAAWTAAFSATWEGSAALPTLAYGNYVELGEDGQASGTCTDSRLFRPRDRDRYGASIPLSPGRCALSMLFSDWARTGRRDLRVSNDRHYYREGEEQLWRVAEGEPPRLYTRDEGWAQLKIWGMGIASQDVTGDGLPEVYLTSQGDNKLQTLEDGSGRPAYHDIAIRRGVTAHRPFAGDVTLPSTAWHAEFQDVNNDSFMDLFVTKGNVDAMPDYAARDPSNLFIGQPDGRFVEGAEAAGLVTFARGRGGALVDFNLDGLLDLVQVNRRENVKLWRNVGSGDQSQPGPMGNWIGLRIEQPGPNPNAIGSWIELRAGDRTTVRELTVGGGHAGGQLGWVHFGLGGAERAEVQVTWPDGEMGPRLSATANQFLAIRRDATEAVPWSPGG